MTTKQIAATWYKKLIVPALTLTIAATTIAALPTPSAHAAAITINSTTTATAAQKADAIITLGKKYFGTPYKFAASTNTTKVFDCSSFTKYVFGQNGIKLNRSARDQAKQGTFVAKKDLRPGDLVFFHVPSRPMEIGHVGIYVGNNTILHTYGAGGVKLTKIDSGYWARQYVTARRVI